jgi:hypothetical protein
MDEEARVILMNEDPGHEVRGFLRNEILRLRTQNDTFPVEIRAK